MRPQIKNNYAKQNVVAQDLTRAPNLTNLEFITLQLKYRT